MRVLSDLALIATTAAFGFAAGAFALTLSPPPVPDFTAPERAAKSASLPAAEALTLSPDWPPLFGVVAVPEPDPEPEPEPVAQPSPEPEPEPVPEISSMYYLTGLVARGDDRWAMVTSNASTRVVREGDELEGGEIVLQIDADGVWIDFFGNRQVIPVQRSDLSGLVQIELVDARMEEGDVPATEMRWTVEALDARFIEEALAEAGRLQGASQIDGTSGLEVVTVQSGQLYDQIGLRPGDTILRVNGKSVNRQGLPADAPRDVVDKGQLDLEILRDGARQVIRVNVEQI